MNTSNDRRIKNKIKVNMHADEIRCGRTFQAPIQALALIYRLGTQRRDKRRRCKGDVATSMREEGRPEWEIAREKRRSGSVFRVAEVFLIGFLSFFFFWVQFFQSIFFDCLGFFCYGPPCIFIIKR